jgi:GWxTD domain-containing protein
VSSFHPKPSAAVAAGLLMGLLLSPGVTDARGFVIQTRAFRGENRETAVRVTADVPFSNLVFLKHGEEFRAEFEVYLSIRRADDDKKLVRTAVIRGDAVADSYEQTGRSEKRSRPSKVFMLDPGNYVIDATLAVRNTNLKYEQTSTVTVPEAKGIGFSTPEVFSIPSDREGGIQRWEDFRAAGGGNEEDELEPAGAAFDEQTAVRFEVYGEKDAGGEACELYYEVVDAGRKKVAYGKKKINLRGKDDVYVISFVVDDWEPGRYELRLRAVSPETGKEGSTSVRFNIDVTRAMLGEYFDDTLGMLSLIADKKDLEALKNAPPERRHAEWEAFWRKRDPDPSTPRNEALEEYLRRVRVVQEKFSGFGPGWRSDRGRIYIRYGAPEQIDRTTDRRRQGEYEVWRYFSLNRTFVFYDMFGLGDFKLVDGDMF